MGPTKTETGSLGQFSGTLSTNQSKSKQTIYVVKNLRSNLLGLPATYTCTQSSVRNLLWTHLLWTFYYGQAYGKHNRENRLCLT